MTAKEKLKEICKLAREVVRGRKDPFVNDLEISQTFEKNHCVRRQNTCSNCRFCVPDYDGIRSCLHPDRFVLNGEKVIADAYCSIGEDSICDAWELRTDQNEDIPELTPFQIE